MLELSHFSDNVSDLEKHDAIVRNYNSKNYHSHFCEIEKSVLSEVVGPFFYVGEVREVNAEVRNTRRITSGGEEDYFNKKIKIYSSLSSLIRKLMVLTPH